MTENKLVVVDTVYPENIYIFPIRYKPVFPGMITPMVISPGKLADSLMKALETTELFGLLLQKDDTRKGIDEENLYRVGTLARVVKKMKLPDEGYQLLVNILSRFEVVQFLRSPIHRMAKVMYHQDDLESDKNKELIALTRAVLSDAKEVMNQNPLFTEEMKLTLVNVDEPGKIADFVCSILNLEKPEFQEILETFNVENRLEKALSFLAREIELLHLQKKIQNRVEEKVTNQQREGLLREQLQAIRKELGIDGKSADKDAAYYREKVSALALDGETLEKVMADIEKLENIDSQANEYGVLRNYLDTVIELPWANPEYTEVPLEKARKILNRDHLGLEEIKDRIIEILALRIQKKAEGGSIICFVGPPGVGKTSLGRSIAKAMDKQFYRFSLGGMRDEAEIKGHRRTYVGAMPGKLIQAMKIVKSKDPVLMLDEIDKLGKSFQGDPASALLEVLDPEQNSDFRDHYLDLPFDLSYVTFITTANTLETIPGPLIDRMEVIRLSGYILEEKVKIAQKYLVPKTIKDIGLNPKEASKISAKTLRVLIDQHSREAGIRSLEQQIKKVFRKNVAAKIEKKKFPQEILEKDLADILGPPRFKNRDIDKTKTPGTAIGLAYTSMGGATLTIESAAIPGKGPFKLTGQLGKVMTESADIALTYVRSILKDEEYFTKNQIHIHVPDGATPKDGPSAGITITTALLSLYYNKPMKSGFAMTGEIRLTGHVLPIGGLKEKTIAARRVGIKKIIFPYDNQPDWDILPDQIKRGIKPYPVKHYDEVKKLLF